MGPPPIYYSSREAAGFVRAFTRHHVSAELRAPYDERTRRLLAGGGVLRRAELALQGDVMKLKLVVQRGGPEEAVDAGDDAIPMILLNQVPLFVEIELLKQVGGWRPPAQ